LGLPTRAGGFGTKLKPDIIGGVAPETDGRPSSASDNATRQQLTASPQRKIKNELLPGTLEMLILKTLSIE
jgi:hypothetical protein